MVSLNVLCVNHMQICCIIESQWAKTHLMQQSRTRAESVKSQLLTAITSKLYKISKNGSNGPSKITCRLTYVKMKKIDFWSCETPWNDPTAIATISSHLRSLSTRRYCRLARPAAPIETVLCQVSPNNYDWPLADH